MEELLQALQSVPKLVALMEESIKLQKEGTVEKKWLGVKELALYLDYSKDKVYKIAQNEWIEGVHYYKPTGRLIFDKAKIDEWVEHGSNLTINAIVDDLFHDITEK